MMQDKLFKMFQESDNIVCLCGLGAFKENGIPNFREDPVAYEVELQYGYSPEELFCSTFYHTRTELFFKYYKERILQLDVVPNETFRALARLEEMGKLKCTVTRAIHGLLEQAGCRHVVNLLGTIENNACPKCHRQYSASYMKNAPKVPVCEKCRAPIRPGVVLMGEMVPNNCITEAAEAISAADLLLVIGCNLNAFLSDKMIQYYNGDKLVLINEEEHFADRLANFVIHDKVINILPDTVRGL